MNRALFVLPLFLGAQEPKPAVAPLYEKYLAERAALDPTWATDQGLHDHDDKLTVWNDATRDAVIKLLSARLDDLKGLDPSKLSVDERLDAALWKAQLETELYDFNRRDERKVMPGMPLSGIYAIHSVLIKDFAPIEKRAAFARSRLGKIPSLINEARARLDKPPRVWTEMAIDDLQGAVAAIDEFVELMRPGLTEAERLSGSTEAAAKKVQGWLEVYVKFLKEEILPRSTGSFAAGKDVYEFYLKKYHLFESDAATLLALGHREWKATLQLLEETAKKIDPAKTWQAILEDMKKDHPKAADLVETYRREVAKARQFMIDQKIVTLPEGEKLEIVETPAFERSSTPYAAYHAPGPLDASRVGHFYVTPVDAKAKPEEQEAQLAGHNIYDIPGTVWHEAYPGHHTQFVHAKLISSKVRALNSSPLLSEGWGMYCEELAHETGYFTDPRTRLMQLNWRLQRAARVILDVSLHAGAMTFEDAVKFLMEKVQMERPHAEGSVKAYTARPTYFMSYMVGMLELKRIRESLKARLGAKFTLQEFHDRVLKYGNVPPALIEIELNRDWK
ncbi:MAG TPA: DUF885 domain-containing protein [Planctomycetota bacterium]|nr:DUF885 domain-containing protein [Planctomycetota bacterium]